MMNTTADQTSDGFDRLPLSRLRRRIGENMVNSLATSPHVTLSVDVNYHQVDELRGLHGDSFRTSHGFSLTYLPFVARAVAHLLVAYPDLNASIDGTDLLRHNGVHLGIAVDLARGGLVVPVIRNSQDRTLIGLAEGIRDFQVRAGERKLLPDDVQGGTFTISSPGRRGADRTTPIIHQPQCAILAIDAIAERPAVVDGELAVRPIGALSMSFDHRIVDGVYATAFLTDLRDRLQTDDSPPATRSTK